jgi:GcrA cell cycle regulator
MIDWTAELEAKVRALWDEGHSTAQIGLRMGFSKNAVVGKAHRLGLSRASPIRAPTMASVANAAHRRARQVPRLTEIAPISAVAPVATSSFAPTPAKVEPKPSPPLLTAGRRVCDWPNWGNTDRPTHDYCGLPVWRGSYCAAHHKRAYAPYASSSEFVPTAAARSTP